MKILLDTDPGSDIDDAIAMAFLAKHPDCELLGVTTVTGDVCQRAAIAEIVLREFGKGDVPIVAGAKNVFLHGPGQPRVPHYPFIADLPHRLDRPTEAAVDFLRSQIKANPGEVTLLTIGPLTNAAALVLLDPTITDALKQVVMMAGWFHFAPDNAPQGSEWNVECDPVASAIFFSRCHCPMTVVPLDVTLKCTLAEAEFKHCFAEPPKDVILRMTADWFKGTGHVTFHDPLACALLFRPELCTYRTGRVSATAEKGFTTLEGEGLARVAETVDAPAFFEEYFRVVG